MEITVSDNNDFYRDTPRYGFVKCDGCGENAPCHTQERLPDNGWALPYQIFGYYGGFTDDDEGQSIWDKSVILCHSCVLRFLDFFPLIAKRISKGGHSLMPFADEAKPCCDYAWTLIEGETYLAENGEWVKAQ